MNPTENENSARILPGWYQDILTPLESGSASVLILHGDLNCLVENPDIENEPGRKYIKFREFWRKILKERKMVIFFNIASGIIFLEPKMEEDFKKAAGIVEEVPAGGANPAVAAARASLAAKRSLPTEPNACLELIEKVLRKEKDVVVLLNSAHFIAPAGGGNISLSPTDRVNIERLRNWSQSETLRTNKNLAILLTDQSSKISPELRQGNNEIPIVFIPKPNENERKKFIISATQGLEEQLALKKRLSILKSRREKIKKGSDIIYLTARINAVERDLAVFSELAEVGEDFSVKTFTIASQGLSLAQISEIFAQCKRNNESVTLKAAQQIKITILNNEYGDVMEIVNPEKGLEDIGGMQHIKGFFGDIIKAIKNGEKRRVPMGVTLMGPPGTGKTAVVEALAKEAGFNFVKTKSLRSMWVGESEAKSERCINGLRSLMPVVVMNDEADLGEANRDAPKGDSGVSERLMRMWMMLLSDPAIRGNILVINCTNRIDRMDAALKRSGRSDERILLPMPSVEEIPAIFAVMFRRYKIATSVKNFSKFAALVNGRSGADVERIVLKAFEFAGKRNLDIVGEEALTEAINDFIPSASQAEIDYMTMVGFLESSSRRLLPPNSAELLTGIKQRGLVPNADELLTQIKERNIVNLSDLAEFTA